MHLQVFQSGYTAGLPIRPPHRERRFAFQKHSTYRHWPKKANKLAVLVLEHGPVWWWSWSCGVRCGSRDHPDLPETLTIYGRVTIRSLCAQAPNTPPLAPQPAHLQQPYCASEVEVTSTVVAGQPNLRSDSVTIRRSLQPPPSSK